MVEKECKSDEKSVVKPITKPLIYNRKKLELKARKLAEEILERGRA